MDTLDNSADELPSEPSERGTDGRFLPGNKTAAGRKGARNRLSTALLETLAKDFEEHGNTVVTRVRTDRPSEYLKVMAALVPKHLELEGDNPLIGLSSAEIQDLIALVQDMRKLEGVGESVAS